MKSFQSQTHYEVLEISVSASADEVKSAYERLSRLYGDDQVVLYGMVDGGRAAALRARLKEALEVLTDDERRDRYDVSIGLPPRDLPVAKKVPPPRTSAPVAGAAASAATGWGTFAWVSPSGGPTPSAPTAQLSYTVPAPATLLAQPPPPRVAPPVAPELVAAPAPVTNPSPPPRVEVPAPVPTAPGPAARPEVAPPAALPPEPVLPVAAPSAPRAAEAVAFPAASAPVVAAPAPVAAVAAPEPAPVREAQARPAAVGLGLRLLSDPVTLAGGGAAGPVPSAPVPAPVAASPAPELARSEPAPTPPPLTPLPPLAPQPVSAPPVSAHPPEPPPPADAAAPEPAAAEANAPAAPVAPPDDTPRLGEDVEVSIVPARTNSREFRIEQRPKPYEVPPGVEFNGDLLRQVRMARGLSLLQLSERTRIGVKHLENVEGDRYDALPAGVYLRGILMNLARELGLDGLRVSKSYLTFVEAHRSKG